MIKAQSEVTIHVEKNALFYVEKNVTTSVNGGVQLKGDWKNRGNVIISGYSNSIFSTLKQDNSLANITDIQNGTSGKFLNLLNTPDNYALPNTTFLGNNYTYGQLYLKDFSQSNITGFVSTEYRNVNHGGYQQIGLPFYEKKLTELNMELGKTFSSTRWSQNEILKWNNNNVVFDYINPILPLNDATAYYILGNKNNSIDISSITKTISGIPYADGTDMIKILQNAGKGIDFGINGTASNEYREKYNSYLQDGFELQSAVGGIAWQGNFGKNIYQFANPFLTNLDLRNIFVDEINGDGVFIDNIYALRLEQASGTISYTPGVGGGATSFRYVTWDKATNSPIGDIDWLIVRPLGTFVIKLKDNASTQTLNFNNLRRFSYIPRISSNYSITTKTSINTNSSSVKQLGVIALDAEKKEIGRSYYVVSPNAKSGHQNTANYQISASSSNVIGSFEENPLNGGYDSNLTSKYWLYINEANQDDFKGKPIPMVVYGEQVKYLKFELRENSLLAAEGTQELTSGIPFYFKINNELQKIKQFDILPITVNGSLAVQIYYGEPQNNLNSEIIDNNPSRTMVIYNSEISKYYVKFDNRWKNAELSIFDASGKLIFNQNKINCKQDYIIENMLVSGVYLIKIISDTQELKISKIIVK